MLDIYRILEKFAQYHDLPFAEVYCAYKQSRMDIGDQTPCPEWVDVRGRTQAMGDRIDHVDDLHTRLRAKRWELGFYPAIDKLIA